MSDKFSQHLQAFSTTDDIERDLKEIERVAQGDLSDKKVRGEVRKRLAAMNRKYPNDSDFTPDQANRLGRLGLV